MMNYFLFYPWPFSPHAQPFAIELAKTAIELVRQCSSCREMLPLNGGHFVTDYHFNFGTGE